jgi:pimeloyl-ACP methyl ester carboxylesterase
MARSYQAQEQRMVDGIHPLSKMLGDVKFHEHKTVEAATPIAGDSNSLPAISWLTKPGPSPSVWAIHVSKSKRNVANGRRWLSCGPAIASRRYSLFIRFGGNVMCYAQLARHLGPEQSFYGLQSFGLADDQSPLTDISEMARRYLEALRRVQPEGPYLLGGWSMGGLIAFEMVQQLQSAGQEIALLALLDSQTPASFGETDISDEALWRYFKSDRNALYGADWDGPDSDQLSRLFQVFRANVHAMMSYEPKRYAGTHHVLPRE